MEFSMKTNSKNPKVHAEHSRKIIFFSFYCDLSSVKLLWQTEIDALCEKPKAVVDKTILQGPFTSYSFYSRNTFTCLPSNFTRWKI